MSLKKFDVYTTIPVSDVERARGFYREILGLKEMRNDSQMPSALFQAANNTRLYLYLREPTKAEHTVLSFRVKHIEKVVAELQEKGVRFESYDLGDAVTENTVSIVGTDKAVWFKDTEGNLLNLYEKGEATPKKEV